MARVFGLNAIGLIVMVVSVGIVFFAGRIAARFPEEKRENAKIAMKFAGMGVCIAGFLIAMCL